MINIGIMYVFLIAIFAVVGYLRGWQREVIAMAGLVASVAALNQFAFTIARMLGMVVPAGTVGAELDAARVQQFWLQFGFHCMMAFFSYQMISRLADALTRGRLGDRLRSGLESRITGFVFGILNGYLFVGALWGFLEYVLVEPTGYERLSPLDAPYPFAVTIISRPVMETFTSDFLALWLPMHFSAMFWLVTFFIVFFIVIVALI
ncbi:MAG: CvpA family protein [Ardenticatenaceae bacterium]|nr:CvpA family protein [Anaerolineales bacterium]MCB8918362.1 CvpA family protein [Ardenticatenaceae bacterium]